jgi:hypothetical protein
LTGTQSSAEDAGFRVQRSRRVAFEADAGIGLAFGVQLAEELAPCRRHFGAGATELRDGVAAGRNMGFLGRRLDLVAAATSTQAS